MTKLVVIWLAGISIAAGCLAVRPRATRAASFDRLTVHRIDIVEPDGKPREIVSNANAYPEAIVRGKEYPHPGRVRLGGVLFFNDDGSEAGGWGYANMIENGHRVAGAILTMDQYDQDETLALAYNEQDGAREAGLTVFGDHSSVPIEAIVAANAAVVAAKTDAERATAKAKLDKLVADDTPAAKRVFVGRGGDVAAVLLMDRAGVPRLMMQVDGTGEPTLQFLDAEGKPTTTY